MTRYICRLALVVFFIKLTSCGLVPEKSNQEKPAADAPGSNIRLTNNVPKNVQLQANEILFNAEAFAGSNMKNTLSLRSNQLLPVQTVCTLDKSGNEARLTYPANYGFASRHFKNQQSRLKMIVFGRPAIYEKMITAKRISPQIVRVIGIMNLEECSKSPCNEPKNWEKDWKIIAVDKYDPDYQNIKDVKELNSDDQNQLTSFYGNYKGFESLDGELISRSKVEGFSDSNAALTYIEKKYPLLNPDKLVEDEKKCQKIYQSAAKKRSEKKNKNFLKCIELYDYPGFHPENELSEYFVKYTALQLLLKLKDKEATLVNALDRMKKREAKGLNYYRFIKTAANTEKGTSFIGEWVKINPVCQTN